MKTFFTLALLQLLSVGLFGQVCLKGICLGEKGVNAKMVEGTVGGMEGIIITYTVNDGRIHTVGFGPGIEDHERIALFHFDQFLTALETNFNVKFNFYPKVPDSEDGNYKASFFKDEREYHLALVVEINRNLKLPVDVLLFLSDAELQNLSLKERQQKAISDF